MDIGKIINERRNELGMTLEELGEKVGVTKSTVKKWESGYIKNMRRDKIELLANTLKLSPVTFITGEIHPITQSDKQQRKTPEKNYALSEGEEYLLELFRKIPDDKKQLAIEMLKAALQAK